MPQRAYTVEKIFKQTVPVLSNSSVPKNANVLLSDVIYKLKQLDDNDLKMKEQIAPHGNENQELETLRIASALDSPVAICVVASVSIFFMKLLAKMDFVSAFL